MKRNSTSGLGALHPILFFLFVYGISLFLALFVCRTVFFSIYDNNSSSQMEENIQNMDDNQVASTNLTTAVFK